MDVVRLGPRYSTSYLPDVTIEGFSSMIWTERYQAFGEFELRSPRVEYIRSTLPEDTLVSHQGTDVAMIVESHEITENDEGEREIVVKGRSLDSFLEHRFVEGPYQKKRLMRQTYNQVTAAAVLLWQAFDNASGWDVTRAGDHAWNTLDQIPNVAITDSVASDGVVRKRRLTEGNLWPQIQQLMIGGRFGVRTIRPGRNTGSTQLVGVGTNPTYRGNVTRTTTSGIPQLRFDLYNGVDKSSSVAFSVRQGHLESPSYVFSNRERKTVIELMTDAGLADIYEPGTTAFSGIRRRVMELDVGSPDIPAEPEKPEELKSSATKAQRDNRAKAMDKWIDDHREWRAEKNRIMTEFIEEAKDDATAALSERRQVKLFSGDISPLAPYDYGVHYNLGDTVSLLGEYGETEKMVISEFIVAEDANGERSYPTLASI